MPKFELVTPYEPAGDQPLAIDQLCSSILKGDKYQTLLGVTGSGKTFTMASVITKLNRPALIFAPNKTLAAQLYLEFKQFFPKNAVEYFVSYYDYYQPEAYVPHRDLFIEKDAQINEELDKFRLSATRNLYERRDTIVVASVSCIYGLGNPTAYLNLALKLKQGETIERAVLIRNLVAIQYQRNDIEFSHGNFRVRGDVIELYPAYEDRAYRIELFGNEIDSISVIDPLRGITLEKLSELTIWPRTHYVTPEDSLKKAIADIQEELAATEKSFIQQNKLVEQQRLHQRISYDIEMMREMGYCSGIENYSRFLDGRKTGEPPSTLLDYFPEDYLLFIDESHRAIGQLNGMYNGDRSRKQTLVDYGFRLPSALDNRPLKFDEFSSRISQAIFVSATPSPYELSCSKGVVVEQLIRPTGLIDPEVVIMPVKNQVEELINEAQKVILDGGRVLVTVLTKKLAEQLTEYCVEMGIKAEYLHSEIDTLERIEILKSLRQGKFDVLIGINLLREGLDLPEVSLVAILDADKEGFLRSKSSLVQTIGRAARNLKGRVILFADNMTESIIYAIDETNRRRSIQRAHNELHGITPTTITKNIDEMASFQTLAHPVDLEVESLPKSVQLGDREFKEYVTSLEVRMKQYAAEMRFEEAAKVRDELSAAKRDRLLFPTGQTIEEFDHES